MYLYLFEGFESKYFGVYHRSALLDFFFVPIMKTMMRHIQPTHQPKNYAIMLHDLWQNLNKTKFLKCNSNETIIITDSNLLGSMLAVKGRLPHETVSRTSPGWIKWRSTAGVLCD